MENCVIPEPQRTYLLELLDALGPAAQEFVIAGAQAMKFMVQRARATKDIDFVLDVVKLRGELFSLGPQLKRLGYEVVDGARNFQFEKRIPNSPETIRIEFMAPEEFKRDKDFRVDVQNGIHARACTGGAIALAESEMHQLAGKLPDGSELTLPVRVTKPNALVMLKLLALDDRFRNLRGAAEAQRDREEARVHASDIVAIVSAQSDLDQFSEAFRRQLYSDLALGKRVSGILTEYFNENVSPGILVYEEFLIAGKTLNREARRELEVEIERAYQLMKHIVTSMHG
jgi:hypothetical protein